MRIYIYAAIAGMSLIAGGCQSTLWVSDTFDNNGIPIKSAQAYVMTGVYKRHTKNGVKCTENSFVTNVSLPTGATYYVNVKNGPLASSAFNLSTHPSGVLSTVGLNSTPAVNETIDSLAGAATEVLFPLLGVGATNAGDSGIDTQTFVPESSNTSALPACDTGPTNIHIIPLEDVITRSRLAGQPS